MLHERRLSLAALTVPVVAFYEGKLSQRLGSRLLMLTLCAVFVGGCAYQPSPNVYHPPGFFSGLLHGFLILLSLIGSIIFDVRIYASPNTGFFYDLGYFIGALISLGGAGSRARAR